MAVGERPSGAPEQNPTVGAQGGSGRGRNWRKELPKFHLAYRSTPQVSTGSTPAFLMLGREPKTKPPELRGQRSFLDESFRECDWQLKLEHKVYADSKCGATNSSLALGDQVLLRNT